MRLETGPKRIHDSQSFPVQGHPLGSVVVFGVLASVPIFRLAGENRLRKELIWDCAKRNINDDRPESVGWERCNDVGICIM